MENSQASISNSNYITKCVRALKELSLQLFSLCLPEDSRGDVLQTLKMNWSASTSQIVRLKVLIGRVVLNRILVTAVSFQEAWATKRFRVGVFVGAVAVPAWYSYRFFDINVRDYDFYFINWVFYFKEVHVYLSVIFVAIGAFLCCPTKLGFRWWALPAVMFCATEVYQISNYTHYTDYVKGMPGWQGWSIVLCVIPAFFFTADYIAYRKYHLKDGTVARIVGVIEMDIPWSAKESILKKEANDFRNLNARV